MEGEEQVAVLRGKAANQVLSMAIEKLEDAIEAGSFEARILLPQVGLRPDAGKQPVGVDLDALDGDVAILVVDEIGDPRMGVHIEVQHLARGVFVTMNMEVAAAAAAFPADIESHARQFRSIAVKRWEQPKSARSQEFATVHST
jgi:hypothetical protein